jgi:hypothetical protein
VAVVAVIKVAEAVEVLELVAVVVVKVDVAVVSVAVGGVPVVPVVVVLVPSHAPHILGQIRCAKRPFAPANMQELSKIWFRQTNGSSISIQGVVRLSVGVSNRSQVPQVTGQVRLANIPDADVNPHAALVI